MRRYLILGLLCCVTASAAVNKSSDRIQRRADNLRTIEEARVEEVRVQETPWTKAQIYHATAEVYPVDRIVGFLAVERSDPERLQKLLNALQTDIQKLKQMRQQPVYFGRELPDSIRSQLNALNINLMQQVATHYGAEVQEQVKELFN